MGEQSGEAESLRREVESLRAEVAALRVSESTLRAREDALLDSPATATAVVDADLRLLAQNDVSRRLSGRRGTIGAPFVELIPAAQAERVLERARRVVSTGLAERFETSFTLATGVRIVRSVYQPFKDPAGKVLGLVLISEDITEQRAAERALADELRLKQTIFDTAPYGILVYHAGGQCLSVNRPATELVGGTREQLLAQNFRKLSSWRDAGMIALADEVLETGVVANCELRLRSTMGKDLWFLVHMARFEVESEPRLLVVSSDIWDRKRTELALQESERNLRQFQKLESIGRLAGGVAHDFNNMLGVILGHADLLDDALSGRADAQELVDEIRSAATRSADLTRQLLAFARKQTVAPRLLDLNATIEGTLKMLRRLIGEEIELAFVPAPHRLDVEMDPSQVDQILANLAVNARDAIAGQGRVTIETSRVTVGVDGLTKHPGAKPGQYVVVAVQDTGAGMDEETLAHVFEPFFTTKDVGKGTGLGLATVYGIVEQNAGFIDVISIAGKGATFRVHLPASGRASTATTPLAPPVIARGTETILLVEDEEPLLRLAQRVLEGLGYRVLAASKPSEALRLAEPSDARIDLLVTDMIMPEMTGRELCQRLREVRPELPSLFVSGYTPDLAGRGAELVHFLDKPFTREGLASKVRAALDARR